MKQSVLIWSICVASCFRLGAEDLSVGTFDVDVSPPIGSPMAYDPTKGVQSPLSCRGVVLTGAGEPIVLVAVDWIGISSGGQDVFREQIARATGTRPERIVIHTLHQHDAPRCDFAAEELLKQYGAGGAGFDPAFARDCVARTATAIKDAIKNSTPVTHVGTGQGVVEKVASNRRILGPDGKVKHTRYTATRDPKIRAMPVGTVDPLLKSISFWNQDKPLAVLTYYATHPQSYYRTGLANPDFPGMARNQRQQVTGIPHIHFNGAGGNVGAGKWNDGDPKNRQVLADRVAAGMALSFENTTKIPIAPNQVGWNVVPVTLPVASHLKERELMAVVQDQAANPSTRFYAAKNLIWLMRCMKKDTINIACLRLQHARVLFMPGELFVEYQLSAQKVRPELFVAMAAYGDYAPGYIGTAVAYTQGGYETSERASRVAPGVEDVLMNAVRKLLAN